MDKTQTAMNMISEEGIAERAAENIAERLMHFEEERIVSTGPWDLRWGREFR
ncbi:hypothetical protein ACFVFH_19580 [Streptomyces sp. NPDC057697]|uniref:hypothetical protein n=1 Tax=Streptomyces sp. NPDC057697 TaxID=3346219 RepID=UPI00368FC35D